MEVKTTHTIDTTFLDIMETLMADVQVVELEHGFGRNTPNVQAHPTESTTLLYV